SCVLCASWPEIRMPPSGVNGTPDIDVVVKLVCVCTWATENLASSPPSARQITRREADAASSQFTVNPSASKDVSVARPSTPLFHKVLANPSAPYEYESAVSAPKLDRPVLKPTTPSSV